MLPTFDIPPLGPRQGKIWGSTQLLFAHHGVECHRIHAREGGYCSKHKHTAKWNRFVLLSGKLEVVLYHETRPEEPDSTILLPGQVTDVPPGHWHMFRALEDSEALELYWVQLDPLDIDRGGSIGGMDVARTTQK